jgi:flagellar hook protein FlgE
MGTAGSGGRGAMSAGALESSNVDLAEEFVGLIQHQRSFSANSKTITTADEMLQELINIKR